MSSAPFVVTVFYEAQSSLRYSYYLEDTAVQDAHQFAQRVAVVKVELSFSDGRPVRTFHRV